MELEIKEADLIKIQSGDILVLKVGRNLTEQEYRKYADGLNFLKNEVKSNSGKDISISILIGGDSLEVYRPVKKGGSKNV